ncbi:hypothetical protein OIT44_04215 [Weissella ceti]|uniref:Uncharacterized protein n=1 Tax=Weissella ceti TaxID=759620 RepID=A0ABT3E4D0_9LACO|nr:hypothetical protein [Weissella ceti]MCW0953280.1 hypothetical protein [Weissella ceti]QVK11389.1 hypothetical protein KHQ31_03970 [Weissella ceti]
MSEQKMIEARDDFRLRVTAELRKRGYRSDTQFVNEVGISTLPAFTAAVTTYTMSDKSIELRGKIRRLLDIEDA